MSSSSSSELPFLFLARVSPQTRSQKMFLVHVHLILLNLHPSFMSWHGRHFKVYVQVQVLWKRKTNNSEKKALIWTPGCEAGNYFREQEVVIAFPPSTISSSPPPGGDHPGAERLEKCSSWASITTCFCWLFPGLATSCWSWERS